VVSTRIGAEGIEASDGEHILLADDPNAFTSAILRLLHEPITFNNMRRAARRLVEARYDWALIGDRMNAALKLCCKTPAP
jgi:glycosyltransferase involved in cell wall biosynthesis